MTTFLCTVTVAADLRYERAKTAIFVQAVDREDAARKARQWACDKHWRRQLTDIDIAVRVTEDARHEDPDLLRQKARAVDGPKPFPFDWEAWSDDYDSDRGSPVGFGSTEAEAIADLMTQLEEREE